LELALGITAGSYKRNGSSGVAGVDEVPNRRESRTDRVDRLVLVAGSVVRADDGGAEDLRTLAAPGAARVAGLTRSKR